MKLKNENIYFLPKWFKYAVNSLTELVLRSEIPAYAGMTIERKLKLSILSLISFSIFFITSCQKEEIDYAPKISLVSMAPLQVVEYTDSIVFTIKYEDADGDIGIPDADINSLWLKDARLDKADEYFIAPLGPLDTEVAIEGEFRINLKNTFRLGTASSEKTKFTIWLKDRAGNESNIIETPELTISE